MTDTAPLKCEDCGISAELVRMVVVVIHEPRVPLVTRHICRSCAMNMTPSFFHRAIARMKAGEELTIKITPAERQVPNGQ